MMAHRELGRRAHRPNRNLWGYRDAETGQDLGGEEDDDAQNPERDEAEADPLEDEAGHWLS